MASHGLSITPFSPALGAVIAGVDLSRPIPDASFAKIRQAFFDHGVIFFRDQSLTPEQHIAFARRWAPIDINRFFKPVSGHPEIAEVRKEPEQTTNIGGGWHTDHSYDQVPAMGSILLARELPPSGGDTLFASMYAAYDSLSDGLKATLETMRAVHTADHIYGHDGAYAKTDIASIFRGHDEQTLAVHPVIITHPTSGRKALYVNPSFTTRFDGWTREESLPLLQYLYAQAIAQDNVCTLQWKPGSVAIWDNRASWHFAKNDYHGHRRVMHRITIAGCALS